MKSTKLSHAAFVTAFTLTAAALTIMSAHAQEKTSGFSQKTPENIIRRNNQTPLPTNSNS